MTTGGTQSNWSEGKRLSEEPERGTIAALVALAVLVGGEARCALRAGCRCVAAITARRATTSPNGDYISFLRSMAKI